MPIGVITPVVHVSLERDQRAAQELLRDQAAERSPGERDVVGRDRLEPIAGLGQHVGELLVVLHRVGQL